MVRSLLAAWIKISLLISTTREERRAGDLDTKALSAEDESASSETAGDNSGSAFELWRGKHSSEMREDQFAILNKMFYMKDPMSLGEYAPITPEMKEAVKAAINTNPDAKYVIGTDTKLVLLPTYKVLKQQGVHFYGNPEITVKNEINPYQEDRATGKYTFKYTEALKEMALKPQYDLEKYLMYPGIVESSKTTNRGEVRAATLLSNPMEYGIKMRGPLCVFLGEYGFLAVPETFKLQSDTLNYLRKILKHQKHEVDEIGKDDVALDYHEQSRSYTVLPKQLKLPKERPDFATIYSKKDDVLKLAVASYHFKATDGKPHLPNLAADSTEMKIASILPGLQLDTHKYGRGMKFALYGANSCLNAIVTRFDEHGHVNFLANIRPDNAHGDRGEFQMTAGVIALECPEFGINTIQSQWPRLTDDEKQVEDTGKLKNDAERFARANIFKKTFSGYDWTKCAFNGQDGGSYKWKELEKQCKATQIDAAFTKACEGYKACESSLAATREKVIDQLHSWKFYKLRAGIVDDQAGTNEAWVETAYVWHHIQGNSDEELELFNIGSPEPGTPQVGAYVWRNIDMRTKMPPNQGERRTTQRALSPGKPTSGNLLTEATYGYEEIDVEAPYDPYVEYDLWHGDHSLGARDVYNAVMEHFEFVEPATRSGGVAEGQTWFGKSKAKRAWMSMHEPEGWLARKFRKGIMG
eukprot:TRINITY_DN2860_c2_g2_i1.p1 TRINITY_DN2860_c2_g2~~TRINITY_DN2860_c2_g2_i1.p1  ORF type:complete len:728 (+),score=59.06 TRINITY_DN2860_c2_g2_i1:98-2185(+)